MSNINRTDPMKYISARYKLPLHFEDTTYILEVVSYNSHYYKSSTEFINYYGLVFNQLVQFMNNKKEKLRIIDFLKHSIEHSDLYDIMIDLDFEIQDDHILFKSDDGNTIDWINMGEFHINNYKINCYDSYMFFEDVLSDQKFMYYGD